MVCQKCGFEYGEGRSCPKCGANSILIHEDYFLRRQEWEEKNAPKAEEKPAKKFQITQETKKELLKYLAILLIAAVLCCGAGSLVSEYKRTHAYKVGFVSADADSQRIYSCDGVFSYEWQEQFSGVVGESGEIFCSADGMCAAAVRYEAEKERYCLYVFQNGESRLIYETADNICILRVNENGSVLLRKMERGDYDIVTDCQIIEVADYVRVLAEEDMSVIETGKENQYCLYQNGQVSITENGTMKSFYIGDADRIVCTSHGIYYLEEDGLYDTEHERIDSNVLGLYYVYGTDEIIYWKEDKIVLLERNLHTVEFPCETAKESITAKNTFVRRGTKIYLNRDGNVEVFDIKKKNLTKIMEGTKAYLFTP